ncbi:phospho-2-dehydro-3-deoxyheptonate aldolase, tyrosine-inhibited [Sphaeroforma arctica JP610]|uniref:3-deoxy-7-phosphoheptulonate synthase n=1 Tax=Sphaeroforma arctica JP610 TaxID=667725 RepID=A0A0L0FJN4_9EUKA|nr:phospho-2-dehydro-3-deoxyheptonate aldolase, tyrosine-inhibited [Sphaeroforma arctica JP610]KNC76238.1 phospho-2-dehydro-3-deoxyheptonate aldolase, tyrosine-inhibited [Sphaeroforma arctica JP610]|eukprot:XP_014150140.1 phospho-2-dehydro-3-deoxyheptonate aldolase, tyrosine-inhibited [Sphaeroforma arctica JP610]
MMTGAPEKRSSDFASENGVKKQRTTDDVNVVSLKPLIAPDLLEDEIPMDDSMRDTVNAARESIKRVLDGADDKLVVIVGPCSIHDPEGAMEYARSLKTLQEKYSDELVVIMRVYFEKPRTTVGWKGLINDPDLDGTFNINKGIRVARKLLCDITSLGLGVGVEYLDTISPQFISDLVAWGAIGARTTESQCHRELSSGVSCPIGFKNGTGGDIKVAADAIMSASNPHRFLGITKQGLAAIVESKGNKYCHLILRGGSDGPNYSESQVQSAVAMCEKNKVSAKIIVDCSHGNSLKLHTNQPKVSAEIARQVAAGSTNVVGVMIESNINEGKQNVGTDGLQALKYGVSVTDACVSLEQTEPMLEELAQSVRIRRK